MVVRKGNRWIAYGDQLAESRYARLYAKAEIVCGGIPRKAIDIVLRKWSRSNEMHVAANNVPQLWKLVDPGGTKEEPYACNVAINHCFELDDDEWIAIFSDAGLKEEDGRFVEDRNGTTCKDDDRACDDEEGKGDDAFKKRCDHMREEEW